MATYTTEITSDKIPSDNPIHQRLLKAYILAEPYVKGDILEVGCGEGRGIDQLIEWGESYTAIDKIGEVVERLSKKYPEAKFFRSNIPPFEHIKSDSFDTVVSFQVIEHIKDDVSFLKEIHRVLKPGGMALISTPNIKKTLTRNPWHIREYTADQLEELCSKIFSEVDTKGVAGSEKVMEYYERNKKSVEKLTKYDIFNLQYRLPAAVLRIPYDMLNRVNRVKLQKQDDDLVLSITEKDYLISENPKESLDLYYILKK
ncbi:MAG: class I SAM-dependent methyltransferase [Bacteroidota bacterium]